MGSSTKRSTAQAYDTNERVIPIPGKTIAEKILSSHSGTDARAGDIVIADVDFVMGQDGTSPLAIRALENMGVDKVFDPAKVALVIDHSSPSPIEGVSALHTIMREFGRRQAARYTTLARVCATSSSLSTDMLFRATLWSGAIVIRVLMVR